MARAERRSGKNRLLNVVDLEKEYKGERIDESWPYQHN